MVAFNPYFRVSVSECLAHPYFENVRVLSKEVVAKSFVEIDIDRAES